MENSVSDGLAFLPDRASDGHKGTFGKVLVVAGSRGMSGAACLAGMAALRGGSGLVNLAVPRSLVPIVAGFEPSYLTTGLDEDAQGCLDRSARSHLEQLIGQNDIVAIGPGLGQSEPLRELIRDLFSMTGKPMVMDADAINALAPFEDSIQRCDAPRILTPHPGEFGRLLALGVLNVQKDREYHACQFALKQDMVVVLKGKDTVVSDGRRTWVNRTGNSGMATGGSGDVLTGLMASFLGQGMTPFDASQLAVYVHGIAGDLAAEVYGETALIASDLVRYLPVAIKRVQSHKGTSLSNSD